MKNFYYDDSPLIYDEHYNRKPAYFALRDAIATLSYGGTVGGNVKLKLPTADDEPWGHPWMPKEDNDTATLMLHDGMSGDCRPDWEQN